MANTRDPAEEVNPPVAAKSNTPTAATGSVPVMNVRKRNGSLEPIDLNKILFAVGRAALHIPDVDPARVAIKTIGGLYDGASTQELDLLGIKTASELIAEEPAYSKLSASLLSERVRKEVVAQDVHSFSQSAALGYEQGLINDRLKAFVDANARKLNSDRVRSPAHCGDTPLASQTSWRPAEMESISVAAAKALAAH